MRSPLPKILQTTKVFPSYLHSSSSSVSCHNKPLSGHTSSPSRREDNAKPRHQSSRQISVTSSRKRRPVPRPLRLRRVLTPHSAGLSGVLRRASAFLAFICNYMESKWVHLHSKWGELLELLLSSRSPDNYQLNMDHPGLSLLLSEWITSDFYSGPHLQHRDHPVNINFRALSLSLTPLLFLLGLFDKMFIHFKKQASPLSCSPPHSRIFFCFDKHIQYSLYPPGLFWARITTWMKGGRVWIRTAWHNNEIPTFGIIFPYVNISMYKSQNRCLWI